MEVVPHILLVMRQLPCRSYWFILAMQLALHLSTSVPLLAYNREILSFLLPALWGVGRFSATLDLSIFKVNIGQWCKVNKLILSRPTVLQFHLFRHQSLLRCAGDTLYTSTECFTLYIFMFLVTCYWIFSLLCLSGTDSVPLPSLHAWFLASLLAHSSSSITE